MVFLILTTLSTESCGYMFLSLVVAANHIFRITKIVKETKEELFYPN